MCYKIIYSLLNCNMLPYNIVTTNSILVESSSFALVKLVKTCCLLFYSLIRYVCLDSHLLGLCGFPSLLYSSLLYVSLWEKLPEFLFSVNIRKILEINTHKFFLVEKFIKVVFCC